MNPMVEKMGVGGKGGNHKRTEMCYIPILHNECNHCVL